MFNSTDSFPARPVVGFFFFAFVFQSDANIRLHFSRAERSVRKTLLLFNFAHF